MSLPARQSLRFPPTAQSASKARHFVVDTLQAWQMEALVDSAALLASEVITNAVLHARTPFTVTLERIGDDCVQIAVSDGSTFTPQRRQPTADSTNGRGIDLLDQLSAAWSVRTTSAGKTVQFTLDRGQDPWFGFVGVDWLAAEL
jgi:anti-sigma regulatory factor (Ser/Thr protein kinase)